MLNAQRSMLKSRTTGLGIEHWYWALFLEVSDEARIAVAAIFLGCAVFLSPVLMQGQSGGTRPTAVAFTPARTPWGDPRSPVLSHCPLSCRVVA